MYLSPIAQGLPLVVALVFLTNSCVYGQAADDSNHVAGQIATGQQATPVQPEAGNGLVATGIVFDDVNGDGKFGDGDLSFAGVKVSNGTHITTTDVRGRYQLPITEDSIIFLIKPTG